MLLWAERRVPAGDSRGAGRATGAGLSSAPLSSTSSEAGRRACEPGSWRTGAAGWTLDVSMGGASVALRSKGPDGKATIGGALVWGSVSFDVKSALGGSEAGNEALLAARADGRMLCGLIRSGAAGVSGVMYEAAIPAPRPSAMRVDMRRNRVMTINDFVSSASNVVALDSDPSVQGTYRSVFVMSGLLGQP